MSKRKGRKKSKTITTANMSIANYQKMQRVNPYNKAQTSQDDCFWTRD
jgi:hypothetical protein